MRWINLIVFGMALWPVLAGAEPVARLRLNMPGSQMILVVTKDWQAVNGTLQRFELNDQKWEAVGPVVPVVVGRNGMGWGRGVHPMPEVGPQKKEGDGRSPAGVFALRYAFGSEEPAKMRGVKLPYALCTSTLECVDDVKSEHYNEVLDRRNFPNADWHSSEKMLMTNGQYRLGIVVEHNTSPAEPGGGSCIFLHIWAGAGIGTSGCTAMSDGDMESLIGWLDARRNPLLVQLPEAEYARVREAWQLPAMPQGK